ncbi:hypothetical protein RN001_002618 [Aquatica leii]|uniref:DUF4806 domain-containing protein n=1 Tax=Aquatica leii TaxID=1421715 RepID=A0AAN7PH55_9COLE|nr:hypothetical protein RN001_002618 [Aquatica leii]
MVKYRMVEIQGSYTFRLRMTFSNGLNDNTRNNNICFVSSTFKGTTSSNTMDNDNNINIEDVPLVILPCIEKSTTNLPTKNSEMLPSETVQLISNDKGYNLLKNVYEKLVKCEILLENHTDRLIKIERHLNIAPVHHEVTPLSMELPLKTIEDIEMFEISLLNDAQSSALLQVLKRTLGSNERTTLFKIFAKLFDYNLATLCSWKGRKHNFE